MEKKSTTIDLSKPRKVHIVGVGGAGMSAIAEVLAGKGHQVTGSDLHDSLLLPALESRGVKTFVGHNAANIGDAELLTYSTAIPATNPEIVEAQNRGIPVLRRAEMLSALTTAWKTLAVAGTHGKTTTSAMLTIAMQGAGLDPSYIVGGMVKDAGRGAAVGSGDHLIVEADESDGTFIELATYGAIVTNVEPDHLEHYGDFATLKKAFVTFVDQCDGPTVVCLDDEGAAELATHSTAAVTYGTSDAADWQITGIESSVDGCSFTVSSGEVSERITLPQPGLHNARNATAAFVLAVLLGADATRVATALSGFGGVGRRFELRGEAKGVRLVDDYAHLPTEVEAALQAGRSTKPARLVAVFQPHRYSRTQQLWDTFGDAFTQADVLVVTGIYSSGEKPREGITGKLIADIVTKTHPDFPVTYIEDLTDVTAHLVSSLEEGDLCMTLGAGDLTDICDDVIEGLQKA